VLSLRLVQRGLRLRDQLLAFGAVLLPRRLFIAALGLAALLLAVEVRRGPCGRPCR